MDSDDVDPGKADRYIEKLMKFFPNQIDVIKRCAGPVKGSTLIKLAPLKKDGEREQGGLPS